MRVKKMKKLLRNCKVCGKEIKCYVEKYLFKGHQYNWRDKYLESDEGFIFDRIWFCNDCWKKIIDYYNKYYEKTIYVNGNELNNKEKKKN